MFQCFFALCAANQPPGTASNRFAFHALYIRTTYRAVGWKYNFPGPIRTLRLHHIDHLGNHIACTTNHDFIANAQTKTGDFIRIMQRGITHQHACDMYRLQPRNRGNCPRTSHLKFDVTNKRHLLLGREFESHRPTRRASNETKLFLERQGIDLNDHAIDIKAQRRAVLFYLVIKSQHCLRRVAQRHPVADR